MSGVSVSKAAESVWAVQRSRGERLSERVADLAATRPRPGSPAAETVAWLNRKGELHMAIADRARALGDVAGAVEAEVLGRRAWRDADDLAGEHGLPVPDCRLTTTSLARGATGDWWRSTEHAGRTASRDVEVADTG